MSDFTANFANLDLREQLARIDRSLDEAAKFRSERVKLDAEAAKLATEQVKLAAEESKLRRERFLAPLLAAGALGGLIAGGASYLLNQLPGLLRTVGG